MAFSLGAFAQGFTEQANRQEQASNERQRTAVDAELRRIQIEQTAKQHKQTRNDALAKGMADNYLKVTEDGRGQGFDFPSTQAGQNLLRTINGLSPDIASGLQEQIQLSAQVKPQQQFAPPNAIPISPGGVPGTPLPPAPGEDPLIVKLQDARNTAERSGNKAAAKEITAQIDALGRGQVLPGELTSVNVTKGQERARTATETLANLAVVKKLLDEKGTAVVGIPGSVKSIINTTLAQFTPALFDADRARFEQAVRSVRESALRTVSTDDRFNKEDRERIEALFPETGFMESFENAQVKIQVLNAFMLRRLSAELGKLGIDKANIPTMNPDSIYEAMQNGLLTPAEAKAALKLLFTPEEMLRQTAPAEAGQTGKKK